MKDIEFLEEFKNLLGKYDVNISVLPNLYRNELSNTFEVATNTFEEFDFDIEYDAINVETIEETINKIKKFNQKNINNYG